MPSGAQLTLPYLYLLAVVDWGPDTAPGLHQPLHLSLCKLRKPTDQLRAAHRRTCSAADWAGPGHAAIVCITANISIISYMSHGFRREVSTVKVGLSVAGVAGVTAVSSDRATT